MFPEPLQKNHRIRANLLFRVSEKNKCAGFWFICKAHPPVHIGGYVLVDATQQTDQRTSWMVYLFFAEALSSRTKTVFSESRRLAYRHSLCVR